MHFDARAAKQLPPGSHIVVDGCSGLRLVASTDGKAWVYRYKSPIVGTMRQIKIGQWPAMPISAAAAKWQELKDLRNAGQDPSEQKREKRQIEKAIVYTVSDAVEDYITGHLQVNREPKGAKAVATRLRNAISGIAATPSASVTRRIAWDLIDSLADRPVLAKSVRNELGGAWDLALDAGKLPDSAPNWWRQIMSGKLRSKGAVRDGVHKGTDKRVLSESEITTLLTVDLKRFSQQVQDFLTIQLWTCTRGAEIVRMTRAQITHEPDGWWWTLPKGMTKGKNRVSATDLRVPLVGRALEIVQRIDTDLIFPSVSHAGVVGPQTQAYMQSKVHYMQPYSNSRPDLRSLGARQMLLNQYWGMFSLAFKGRTTGTSTTQSAATG